MSKNEGNNDDADFVGDGDDDGEGDDDGDDDSDGKECLANNGRIRF